MADTNQNTGPRKLVWLRVHGRDVPQVWFEPYVGTDGQAPVASHVIPPHHYGMTFDELVAIYPAPVQEEA